MIDDASGFIWVGNHAGLDLVNTEALDDRGDRIDLVASWPALVAWALAAELIDADLARRCRAVSQRRGGDVLAWFGRLRSALRGVLESGDDSTAARGLDSAVADVPVRLRYRSGEKLELLPLDASRPLEQLRMGLATAALGAARLDRSRVRRCGSRRCVLLFYDTTKNRSRRWCDMAVCGNRAKARAHYRRTKTRR
jgi:predicted RNA-binding Zn ribbon-like protein